MRSKTRRWGGSLLILVLLALASGNSQAEYSERTLGGHRFIPSNIVPDPFIASYFRNATGAALATNVKLPLLIAEEDTLVNLSGNIAYLTLNFQFQHAVDNRVAFRVGGQGTSRLGTSGESLLTQGIQAGASLDVGTSVRLWNNERFLVTGVADVGFGSLFGIDIFQYVEDVIDEGFKGASLTKSDDGLDFTTGLRGAWALRPWAGLTGFLQGRYLNTVRQEKGGLKLGVAGSIDFGQKGGAPVGLLASIAFDRLRFDRNEKSETHLGGGVFYTGREDFNLGLELTYFRVPLREPDVALGGVTFRISAQYYF